MYEGFFGLERRPFAFLPDASAIYWSERHSYTFAALRDGLARQCPITLVTGEIGAGKTTMIHRMLDTLAPEYSVGVISNFISQQGSILQWVLLAYEQDFSDGSETELLERFQSFVIGEYAAGKTTVLILDEAQNLSDDDIESFRLLTNINIDGHFLFLLVLVGQPELRERLMAHEYRQVMQRVGSQFHLSRLSASESSEYVRHMLSSAGATTDIFNDEALQSIHLATSGVPRKINILSDLCMVSAFAIDVREIDKDFVEATLAGIREKGIFSALAEVIDPGADASIELMDTGDKVDRLAPVTKTEETSDSMLSSLDDVEFRNGFHNGPDHDDLIEPTLPAAAETDQEAKSTKPSIVSVEVASSSAPPVDDQEQGPIGTNSADFSSTETDVSPKAAPSNRKVYAAAACFAVISAASIAYFDFNRMTRADLSPIIVEAPKVLETASSSIDFSAAGIANPKTGGDSAQIFKSSKSGFPMSAAPDQATMSALQSKSPSQPAIKLFKSEFAVSSDADHPTFAAASASLNDAPNTSFALPSLELLKFKSSRSNRPLSIAFSGDVSKPIITNAPLLTEGSQIPFLDASDGFPGLSTVIVPNKILILRSASEERSFGGADRAPLVPNVTSWRKLAISEIDQDAVFESAYLSHSFPVSANAYDAPSSTPSELGYSEHRFGKVTKPVKALPTNYALKLLSKDRQLTSQIDLDSNLSGLPNEVDDAESDETYFRQALDLTIDDPSMAAVLYARAALRGHTRAAYYLGQVYETGDGVAVDLALAKRWYAIASNSNHRARDRIEQLGDTVTGESFLGMPELLLSEFLPGGSGEFVWTSSNGANASDYLIQLSGSENFTPITMLRTNISAAIMPVPPVATHWRVIAINLDQGSYSASPWQEIGSSIEQPAISSGQISPFVTVVSTAPEKDVRSALKQFGISSRYIEALEGTSSDLKVYYFYEQDREPALAIAAVISKRNDEVVLKTKPSADNLMARPGDILIAAQDVSLTATLDGRTSERR